MFISNLLNVKITVTLNLLIYYKIKRRIVAGLEPPFSFFFPLQKHNSQLKIEDGKFTSFEGSIVLRMTLSRPNWSAIPESPLLCSIPPSFSKNSRALLPSDLIDSFFFFFSFEVFFLSYSISLYFIKCISYCTGSFAFLIIYFNLFSFFFYDIEIH